MFVLQKRIAADFRSNTEAEHYNLRFFTPQPAGAKYVVCDVYLN
jgi:hypothetical protein